MNRTKKISLLVQTIIGMSLLTGCVSLDDLLKDDYGCSAPYPVVDEENDDENTGGIPWILDKDVTDRVVLDLPEGVRMFTGQLAMPLNLYDLMDCQVQIAGRDGKKTFSSMVDCYTDSFETMDMTVYDESGTLSRYIPDITLGTMDSGIETTISQALRDVNWIMPLSILSFSDLGFTEIEYNKMCNENSNADVNYILMDKMYDMLGCPNFVGWACGFDNETKYGSLYNAERYIDTMRNPAKYSSDNTTVYSTYVGWQFEDCGIMVRLLEISSQDEQSLCVSVGNISVSYVPSTYGSLEDVYGTNAVSDFLKTK